MRLLLVNPPDDLEAMLGAGRVFLQATEPLGLLSLAAVARAHGHEVSVVDAFAERLDADAVLRRIEASDAEVVGLGVLTCQGRVVFELGQRLRRRCPDRLVVLGNVHASVFADAYLAHGAADLVVHGEGEPALLRVLDEARGARRWERIPGVSYRAADGTPTRTPGVNLVPDLDALPPPARDLVPSHLYGRRNVSNTNFVPGESRRMAGMSTSRGCPFGCSFCVVSADRRVRTLSAGRVVDEMQRLERDEGVGYVFIQDPLFGVDLRRVQQIAREIRRRGLRVPWGCTTHVNTIRPPLVEALVEGNCFEVSLGFESGVQRHLDAIGKRTTPERGAEAARLLRETSDLRVEGMFILGLPGETPDETLRTLLYACRLPIDMAQFSLFTPYPGSAVFERLAAAGRLDTGLRPGGAIDPAAWLRYSAYPAFGSVEPAWTTPAYTPRELVRMQRLALRAFYLRPRPLLDQLRRLRPSNALDMLKAAWAGLG